MPDKSMYCDKKAKQYQHRDRGVVLVSVLWLLLLLSAVALTLVRESRLALQSASIYAEELQVRADIEGALQEVIYRTLSGSSLDVSVAKLRKLSYEIKFEYEHAKLNINTASATQLENYFISRGLEDADLLAGRVLDFRDSDNHAHDGGSEQYRYQLAGADYPPRNKDFLHLYELSRVPGMKPNLSSDLLTGLTVLGGGNQGALFTLEIGKSLGRVRQRARVTLRVDRTSAQTYQILRWQWIES